MDFTIEKKVRHYYCIVDTIQDFSISYLIQTYVQLWPLIKNDPLVIFLSLTKV
jgi:hypothetical protein